MLFSHLWHLLLVLATAATCLSKPSMSRLNARKSTSQELYDPFIICEGNGPKHAEGLPPAYSEDDYALNTYLCSAAHGVPRHNVGCACTRSGADVHCSENIADPDLWNAIYHPTDPEEVQDALERGFSNMMVPFPDHCWANCVCVDPEEAHETGWAGLENALSLHGQSLTAMPIISQGQGGPTAAAAAVPTGYTSGGMSTNRHQGVAQGSWPVNAQPAINKQCGTSCTTDSDCKAPSAPSTPNAEPSAGNGEQAKSSCTCRTQSSQYQPGSGLVAFAAACLIDMATGGKRDEDWPCPCNSTYVSHGCCGVENGLVWEATENKLGELRI